jgi:uncharacterized GH25 family protein
MLKTLSAVATATTTAVLALGCATAANAHQIWVEQAPGQAAVLRFGEFGDNLREVSPGLLDGFGKPTAVRVSPKGEEPLTATKAADGFQLSGKAGKLDSIVAEDAAYPIRKFKQGDKEVSSRYWPAARYVTGYTAQAPKLALDLVPTGKAGEFKVTLNGQPLPKAKVNIVVAAGWAREARADDQGLVQFSLPWKGTYVLEAMHTDATPGERPGEARPEKFDRISYVTSLTLVKADGIAPLAAGPAATPNK